MNLIERIKEYYAMPDGGWTNFFLFIILGVPAIVIISFIVQLNLY